jgi:hypothetical protein
LSKAQALVSWFQVAWPAFETLAMPILISLSLQYMPYGMGWVAVWIGDWMSDVCG